jgi:bifunctional DNA-binding transcriptional regulator/antitoxin component of YhaV-PrlF toxin-antitoxin module
LLNVVAALVIINQAKVTDYRNCCKYLNNVSDPSINRRSFNIGIGDFIYLQSNEKWRMNAMGHTKLNEEEVEKIKIFADATLKILEAFDKMLEDNRIDEAIRKEYSEWVQQ